MLNPYHNFNPLLFTQNAGTRLEINLSALVKNYHELDRRTETARCAAVVKADAYGLGMFPVVQALKKTRCKDFFVAYLDEGIALRSLLDENHNIYVLNGLFPHNVQPFLEHKLIPVLNDMAQIRLWISLCKEQGINHPAVIQFDTGMSRFGIDRIDMAELQTFPLSPFKPMMIMSHLACADEYNHAANAQQLAAFHQFQQHFPDVPASLSASSGIFLGQDWHFDLVRPGAALYGINPTPYAQNPMQTVVSLYSKIIQIRKIAKGTSVGYGASFTADKELTVAILSIGYADGFFRSLSNKIQGRHQNHPNIPLSVIGRISMDCLCMDVSALPASVLEIGEEIELIGSNCPLDTVAQAAGTIGYEVLTALGNRFHRIYKE